MKTIFRSSFSQLIWSILLGLALVPCQAQTIVSGTVVDQQTKETLPFATVHITGTSIGTPTNLEGVFSLIIPEEFAKATLQVSYMGYESQELAIASFSTNQTIGLKNSANNLPEVTIRPIRPEEYIKRAMAQRNANYGHHFSANVYFRQASYDQEKPLQVAEGFVQAYVPGFLEDSLEIQQRYFLFTEEESMGNLAFRKRKREKKGYKTIKKAEKREEAVNADSILNTDRAFEMGLATPEVLVQEDPIRTLASYLDSTHFADFSYTFGPDQTYQGHPVTVIHFKSIKKADLAESSTRAYQTGTLYFDVDSDALVGVDHDSELVIPAAMKPLLFLAGYQIRLPTIRKKVRYLQFEGLWYPQTVQYNLQMDLKKRYWFNPNEESHIDSEILMSITQLTTEDLQEIPAKYRFDPAEDPADQVYPKEGLDWGQVNRIRLETGR